MRLADWLTANDTSDAAFAAPIGVTRQTVARYKSGDRRPEGDVLERIVQVTDGRVTPNDFLDALEIVADQQPADVETAVAQEAAA